MKKPISLALVPAALALALAAGPALAIDVKSVSLTSDHSYPSEVACPVTITFKGAIEVSGLGTVSVQWLRSDGATSAPTKLTFAVGDSADRIVTTTWTLGDYVPAFQPFKGWQKLVVTGPGERSVSTKEGYSEFFVNCQKKIPKFDLAPSVHTPMDGWVSIKNNGPDPSPQVELTLACTKDGLPGNQGCPPFPAAQGSNWGYDGSGVPPGGWGVVSPQLIGIIVPSLPAGQSFTLTFPWWSQLKFAPGVYKFPVGTGPIYPAPDSNTSNDNVVGHLTVVGQVPHVPPAANQKK
jgi:hypothetical protein